MARSILDRLLQAQPNEKATVGADPIEVDFAEAIRRDLEDLLNTRNHFCAEFREDFPETAASVLGYGVPDIDGCMLSSRTEIDGLRQRVEKSVLDFEPRLQEVVVKILEAPRPYTQEVVLEIRGVVRVTAEEIVWNSTLRGSVVTVRRSG